VKKDESGRLQAYGWSIPASIDSQAGAVVPVPVFCRPLLDQQPELKVRGHLPILEAYVIVNPSDEAINLSV
jgi:hypothetical protein